MTELVNLAERYRRRYGWSAADIERGVREKFMTFLKRRQNDLADTLAIGVALDGLLAGHGLDVSALTPSAREAFHAAFPNLSLDEVATRAPSEITDLVNAWKGKVFEIEVRDRLNDGEWVGNWHLEPGQTAVLADSANQPGWDLAIHDHSGVIVDTIQVKATDSFAYVNEALHRYPDTDIIATSDLADHAGDATHGAALSVVSDTSVHDVGGQVTGALDSSDGIDLLHVFLPGAVIAVTELASVAMGKKTAEEAVGSGAGRLVKGAIASAVGGAVSAVLGPWFGIPAAIGIRWLLNSATSDQAPKTIEGEFKVVNIDPNAPVSPETARAFQQLAGIVERLALKYSGDAPHPA